MAGSIAIRSTNFSQAVPVAARNSLLEQGLGEILQRVSYTIASGEAGGEIWVILRFG